MSDNTRALREDERTAMEREMAKLAPDGTVHVWSRIAFEAGFLAGLRYREAEVSEEKVEAAAKALEGGVVTWDEIAKATFRTDARAALEAAREVRSSDA